MVDDSSMIGFPLVIDDSEPGPLDGHTSALTTELQIYRISIYKICIEYAELSVMSYFSTICDFREEYVDNGQQRLFNNLDCDCNYELIIL